jgi:hypothetical protein
LDPDVTPEPQTTKASLKNLLTLLRNLLTPFKNVPTALKNLPIPKKLLIPALAGIVLLTAGGAAFGLLHAKLQHTVAPQAKAVASAPVASTTVASTTVASATVASTTGPSAACSGVVRDIYRQTANEDPSVTLAEVRSEVVSSGVNCAPVPEIAAELKDLSPACRDMVQYTFLGVRDGHPDIKVNDVREKVVQKSVACEHDRAPNIASAARHKAK